MTGWMWSRLPAFASNQFFAIINAGSGRIWLKKIIVWFIMAVPYTLWMNLRKEYLINQFEGVYSLKSLKQVEDPELKLYPVPIYPLFPIENPIA